jgi:hypothetical protein
MRNSRRIIGAFMLSMSLSGTVAWADTGDPGGPNRWVCTFLQGVLNRMGGPNNSAPQVVVDVFEALSSCSFE